MRSRTYEWDDRRPAPALLASLPGIELIRRMAAGELPAPSIAATIGMTLAEVAEGRVAFEGQPGDHVLNPLGTVHGGFAATLLDSVMGCAVHTLLPAGAHYGTAELKVSYIRPLLAGSGTVRAEGSVIHLGRTMATADARLIGIEDGKLYAHGSCTCLIQLPGSR